MVSKKWKYYTGFCWLKPTKMGGLLGVRVEEGAWTLRVGGKEFELDSGLNHMGDLGYELVAVQEATRTLRREAADGDYPTYLYIFKKVVEEPSDVAEDS